MTDGGPTEIFFRQNHFFIDKKFLFVQNFNNFFWIYRARNQYFQKKKKIDWSIKKNKMADKIKMAAKFKFTITKSI
jgi:hypothetical protein